MLKDLIITHLTNSPLSLDRAQMESLISENLFSPFQIELPKNILAQAQEMVKACFSLREHPSYQKTFCPEMEKRGIKDPGNKAICMSYDFHLDQDGLLKLIEINTNASFLALGFEMYKARKVALPIPEFDLHELKSCIEKEMELNGHPVGPTLKTSIIDEQPEQQKLFAEFLLYQALFKQWGWDCEIKDFASLSMDSKFVYNRYNDFYFSEGTSALLKQKFLDRSVCFSPNPFEYLLLADKQRIIDWNNDELWAHENWPSEYKDNIRKYLPTALALNETNADAIWQDKKKFFIKPLRAFGAKQSYRGESISRKNFESLVNQDFIAQQFVPAPEAAMKTPEGIQAFKYDLRFYAYQYKVQMVVARLYQGQVTNLRTTYGGFAPILFV